MRARTHLAFAGLLGVGAAGFGSDITPASGAALALGALLPDVDTGRSEMGRLVRPLSSRLERRFGHRTLTHSLLGLAGLGLLASPLLIVHRGLWIALVVGYGSHLLLDTANVSGVPLLWPARVRFWLVGNRAWRVPYASPREGIWFVVIALTALALTPLALDGFSPWFHRALGTSYGAVEDYLGWKDRYEVWADVRGTNLVTGEIVDGRYRVVDALHTEMLLVEDETGRPYAVGLGQEANITIGRIQVWRGDEIQIVTERLDLAGITLGELLDILPADAERIHVTATLHTPDAVEPEREVGRYPRIRRFGGTLELRSATPAELEAFAWLWIEDGSAIVRMAFPRGIRPTPMTRPESTPTGERIALRLTGLPDLALLQVAEGDHVAIGDTLVRYPEGREIMDTRQALQAARARRDELEREGAAEQQAHDRRRRRLRTDLQHVIEELERIERLVAQDALPAGGLRAAREELADARASLEEHDAAALHAARSSERALREAEADIGRVERRLADALAALEIRSSVAGVVASIRTLAGDREGLDVEIVLHTIGETE